MVIPDDFAIFENDVMDLPTGTLTCLKKSVPSMPDSSLRPRIKTLQAGRSQADDLGIAK